MTTLAKRIDRIQDILVSTMPLVFRTHRAVTDSVDLMTVNTTELDVAIRLLQDAKELINECD